MRQLWMQELACLLEGGVGEQGKESPTKRTDSQLAKDWASASVSRAGGVWRRWGAGKVVPCRRWSAMRSTRGPEGAGP